MNLATPGSKSSVRVGNKYIHQNLDALDDFIGGGEVKSYTPVLSSTGITTPPDIGNGTTTGTWYRFFNLVHVNIVITWGSDSNQGTGNNWFTVSLPVPMRGLTPAFETGYSNVIGSGLAADYSTGTVMPICAGLYNEDSLLFHTRHGESGRGLRQSVPWDWGEGDIITVSVKYLGGT